MEVRNSSSVKRPILISIVAAVVMAANIVLILAFILSFILLLANNLNISEKLSEISSLTPIALSESIIVSCATIITMLGYWKMKKWSVYLFGSQIIWATTISFFNTPKMQGGIPWPLNAVPLVILFILGSVYFKRMSSADLSKDRLFVLGLALTLIGAILSVIERLTT